MAVERIGRSNIVPIELLRRLHAARGQGQAAASRASGADVGDGTNPVAGDAADVQRAADAAPAAEVGPQSAEERERLLDSFKSETADLPDVRRDKVIEAKIRISTGYYNRDEVRREVLRSVLANLLPTRPSASSPSEMPSEAPVELAPEGAHVPGPPSDE